MTLLSKQGRLLLGIGSGGMILFAGVFFIINLLGDLNMMNEIDLNSLNITLTDYTLGSNGWVLSSIITGISGLIGIKGYSDLAEVSQKNDLHFTWGVFGLVLGIVGGTLGGMIIFFAGVLLLISYFKF